MKTEQQIRDEEKKSCEGYKTWQIRANLIIYKLFQFLFSRTFNFIFYAILIFGLMSLFPVSLEIKIFSGIITHFIMFILIEPIINKRLDIEHTVNEIRIVIEVNKEILKERTKK